MINRETIEEGIKCPINLHILHDNQLELIACVGILFPNLIDFPFRADCSADAISLGK